MIGSNRASVKEFNSSTGFTLDTGNNSLTIGGLFTRSSRYNDAIGAATFITDVQDRARRVDIVALNAAGQAVGSLTENGFLNYATFGQGASRAKFTSISGYATDQLTLWDKLRIEGGLRFEHFVFNRLGQHARRDPGRGPGRVRPQLRHRRLCRSASSPTIASRSSAAASTAPLLAAAPRVQQMGVDAGRQLPADRPVRGLRTRCHRLPGAGTASRPTDLRFAEAGHPLRQRDVAGVDHRLLHQLPRLSAVARRADERQRHRRHAAADRQFGDQGVWRRVRRHPPPGRLVPPAGDRRDRAVEDRHPLALRVPGRQPDRRQPDQPDAARDEPTASTATSRSARPRSTSTSRPRSRRRTIAARSTAAGSGSGRSSPTCRTRFELPGYSVFSAGVMFRLEEGITFNASVENIGNAVGLTEGNPRGGFVENTGSNFYFARPINGRNAVASLRFDF
ncbi:hypothetical protein AB5I41_28325 [Sphingomonas sp. MMS24-JH45]